MPSDILARALRWLGIDPAAMAWVAGRYTTTFTVEALRYVVVAMLLWLLLHVLMKRRLAHRLISGWPTARDLRREIAYSTTTLLVFAAIGMGIVTMVVQGRMTVYRNPSQFGWLWLIASLPLMIVWHDFYFYWTHRWLHGRWLFRRVHSVHHRSRHPSPWAAYSFHPVEALINGLVTPLALLVVPLHIGVLIAFGLHQILRNAHGHLAVETMPRGFVRHGFWGRFTTTTHHLLHHENYRGNYGLWFTWWDRWCGTERPDYVERFDRVTQPRSTAGGAATPGSTRRFRAAVPSLTPPP